MITCLQKINLTLAHQIDNTVFLGKAPRPSAGGEVLQWFWFANTGKRISQNDAKQARARVYVVVCDIVDLPLMTCTGLMYMMPTPLDNRINHFKKARRKGPFKMNDVYEGRGNRALLGVAHRLRYGMSIFCAYS